MAVAASGVGASRAAPVAATRRAVLGLVGLGFVVVGLVVQLVALLGLSWFHVVVPATRTVPALSVTMRYGDFAPLTQRGFAHIYFGWGAWVLLALAVGLALAACVQWRLARAFRVTGAIVGVLTAVATILALLTFAWQSNDDVFTVARNYTGGVYVAMLGLLAVAFGAALGEVGRVRVPLGR